jgi:hypothetical protein
VPGVPLHCELVGLCDQLESVVLHEFVRQTGPEKPFRSPLVDLPSDSLVGVAPDEVREAAAGRELVLALEQADLLAQADLRR